MATTEEHNQLSEIIKIKLQQVVTIDLLKLIRENDLGSQLSFKKGEAIFKKMIDLFNKVNAVDLLDVPYNLITAFQIQLDHAISVFDQIKIFDPNTSTPANERDSLISQLEEQFETYYASAIPILTVGLLKSNDLSVEKAKLSEALSELLKEKENAKNESENLLTEIKDVLDKARQAAVEVGVAQHYLIFKEESEEHKTLSELWLKRTIGVLVGIGSVGIGLLFFPLHDTEAVSLIQFTVTKIVVLSVLFYGLAICTRNYKAHKHNSILNKHRQNALNTFETFTKAAGNDTQTKSAVLLEATHTIFSNQQTGFINTDSDNDSPNKIIEIFKNVSDKGL